MTEDQWLSSTCLWDMFQLLKGQPGAQRLKAWRRKFRLCGCAFGDVNLGPGNVGVNYNFCDQLVFAGS
jgi:hypothetical protein